MGQQLDIRVFLGDHGDWGDGGTVGRGTTWRSDLDRGLTGTFFTQRAMTSPQPPEVFVDLWKGAHRAIQG